MSAKPSRKIIDAAHSENCHGSGVAWFNEDGLCQYEKWLYPHEVEKLIGEIPLPFIIHFRSASLGGLSNLLNHPFIISEKSPLSLTGVAEQLLVHNGTIKEYKEILSKAKIPETKDEPLSDSRAMAMLLGKFNKSVQQEKLLKYFSQNNKNRFVLMDSKSKTFKMFGDFTFENGCHYSNMKWKNEYNQNEHYLNYWTNRYSESDVLPTPKLLPSPKLIKDKEEVSYDIPEASPLFGQIKKFLIKNITKNISCCFCGDKIDRARVNRLNIIGYLQDEMACLKCCNKMNYYVPFSLEMSKLPLRTKYVLYNQDSYRPEFVKEQLDNGLEYL